MNRRKQVLERLVVIARKAQPPPQNPPAEPPPGFAHRIAALWAREAYLPGLGNLWERISWWGAAVSATICLLAYTHQVLQPKPNAFDLVLAVQEDDAVFP